MKNGTYSEAVKAGFTPKQAGLFARACCEIKNEAWEHFEKRMEPRIIINVEWLQWVILMAVFGSGFLAGLAV